MQSFKLTLWQRKRLRRQLCQTKDAAVLRRTLAILECDRGETVARTAQRLGVTARSIYRWLASFASTADLSSLAPAPRSGRPALWGEDATAVLQGFLASTPLDQDYLASDWTVPLLASALERAVGRRFAPNTIREHLHRLGYVWKRPRYVLAPDPAREKKTPDPAQTESFTPAQRDSGRGRNRFAAVSAIAPGLGSAR